MRVNILSRLERQFWFLLGSIVCVCVWVSDYYSSRKFIITITEVQLLLILWLKISYKEKTIFLETFFFAALIVISYYNYLSILKMNTE